ncbi:MAG: hypothetical protein HRT54_06460 [Colwellia sp.]|nr:hypothetical protein [Colwellia sp.]
MRLIICLLIFSSLQLRAENETSSKQVSSLKTDNIVLNYLGAFRLPKNKLGISRFSYSIGPMTFNKDNNSLFVVGHPQDDAIAEIAIPALVKSDDLDDLNVAPFLQGFSPALSRLADINTQKLNLITGLQKDKNRLIVNAIMYYDAKARNTDTTFIIEQSDKLQTSPVKGFYALNGKVHAAGWISPVPPYWQTQLDGDLIFGYASSVAINSRLSQGPSAFSVHSGEIAKGVNKTIPSTRLMDFPMVNRLHRDLKNRQGNNDLWTEESGASFGFIVPNSSTYLVIGYSGGHHSDIVYKKTQKNGKSKCPGFCAADRNDYYNHFWMFDANFFKLSKDELIEPHQIRPYRYGPIKLPFEHRKLSNGKASINFANAATFDENNSVLYILLSQADSEYRYARLPVILAFKVENL